MKLSKAQVKVLKQRCLEDFQVKRLLGSGSDGAVYIGCKTKDCDYVLKVQVIPKKGQKRRLDELDREAELTKMAAHIGAAPDFIKTTVCNATRGTKLYIIITRLYSTTLFDWLQRHGHPSQSEALQQLLLSKIQLLENIGLQHNDLHLDNIMVNVDCRNNHITDLRIIDYGRSYLMDNPTDAIGWTGIQSPYEVRFSRFTAGLALAEALNVLPSILWHDMHRDITAARQGDRVVFSFRGVPAPAIHLNIEHLAGR